MPQPECGLRGSHPETLSKNAPLKGGIKTGLTPEQMNFYIASEEAAPSSFRGSVDDGLDVEDRGSIESFQRLHPDAAGKLNF